jgi:hypothetical protein
MKTVTFDEARKDFDKVFQLAAEGETVVIQRENQRVALHGLQNADDRRLAEIPVPIRPAGYFADCYTKAEILEDNRLAKASVVGAPTDLE